jgi:hypothetical protein
MTLIEHERTTEHPVKKANRTYDEIRADHIDHPENYEVVDGHHQRVTYRRNGKLIFEAPNIWDDAYVREQYIRETDEFIGRIDGSITEPGHGDIRDNRIPEGEPRVPDTVIYLDKSARPVAWLVDTFWEQIADKDATKPHDEYLNIDRANWFTYLGHTIEDAENRLGRADFDLDKVNPERIAAIRAYFTEDTLSEENWRDEVWDMPTRLDGQHVMIVDEVMNQGGTLHIAVELLRRAIPEATFDGTYFWHAGRQSIDGINADSKSMQMTTAPIWYSKINPMGRGVGDISQTYYNREHALNPTQQTLRNKIASFALSAPHHDPETFELEDDVLAKKFKQDFAFMSYAMADGKAVRVPSPDRDFDQYKDILAKQGIVGEELRTFGHNRGKYNKDQRS